MKTNSQIVIHVYEDNAGGIYFAVQSPDPDESHIWPLDGMDAKMLVQDITAILQGFFWPTQNASLEAADDTDIDGMQLIAWGDDDSIEMYPGAMGAQGMRYAGVYQ